MLLAWVLFCLAGLAAMVASFVERQLKPWGAEAWSAPMPLEAVKTKGCVKEAGKPEPAREELLKFPAAPPPPASASPLLQLFAGLSHAFEAEKRLGYRVDNLQPRESFARLNAAVRTLVAAYCATAPTDWHRFQSFNDRHYVRHLVEENEDFEMMVICWKKGQSSRVHNHAGSHCWLTTLEGAVEELQFVPVAELAGAGGSPLLPGAAAPCPPLRHTTTHRVAAGQTGYINDFMALHAIRCDPGCCPGEGATTLHLYAPPIRRVKLYDPENGQVVQRIPGFCTVRGKQLEH